MKDVGLRIRLEPELRDQFIQTCHDNHVPAAQVLRQFMRQYVYQANLSKLAEDTLKPVSKQED